MLLFHLWGGGWGHPSSIKATLTGRSASIVASLLGLTLTGVLTPLLFRFLKFLGLAAFYVGFILIMPTLAATSAGYCATEMVLVLHLLTIFSFLLALYLEHASTLPITVGRLAGYTLIICRMTVETIWAPLPSEGGSPSCAPTAHRGLSEA